MWFPNRGLYKLCSSSQVLSYRKLWTSKKESHFEITQSVSFKSHTVFCDNGKCGSQIVGYKALPFKPGFELSQTMDFKKGVTLWDNSFCVLLLWFPTNVVLSRHGHANVWRYIFLGNRWKKKPELPLVLLDPYFVTVMRKERGDNLIRQTRSKIIQMKGCLPWPQCWLPFLF